jgi:O-antigen/teichoic acid export membrane protein
MRHFVRRFSAQPVVVLIGGAASAQLIGILAAPVITRLYTPAQFGLLGVYMSLLGVFFIVATLRFECALPIAKTSGEVASLLVLIAGTGVGTSATVGVVLWRLGPYLPSQLQLLGSFWWFLPLGMCLAAAYQALTYWALREQHFKALASTKFAQAASMIAIQTGGGLLALGPGWLILGHIAGQSMGVGTLARLARVSHREDFRSVSRQSIAAVAKRYRRFPQYSSGAALLDALGGNMPLIVLASIYGTALAGWLTVVQRAFNGPLTVVANALGQVNFADMATLVRSNPGELRKLFITRLAKLAGSAILLVCVLNLVVPFVVPLVFGRQWVDVVPCVQAMSPYLAAGFVSSPLGFALDVTERQDLHLFREIFRAGVMAIALTSIAVLRPSWIGAICIVSIAGTINCVAYIFASYMAIQRADKG